MDGDLGCRTITRSRVQHEPAAPLSLDGIMAFERLAALLIDEGTPGEGFLLSPLPDPLGPYCPYRLSVSCNNRLGEVIVVSVIAASSAEWAGQSLLQLRYVSWASDLEHPGVFHVNGVT